MNNHYFNVKYFNHYLIKFLQNSALTASSRTITNGSSALKRLDEIPGPKPIPLIGNLWRYLPVVGEYNIELLDQNAKFNLNKYGSIVREVIYGSHLILHLFDPKDIETVFRQEGKYPCRRSHRALLKYRHDRPEQYNSGGIFCENGPEWLRLRQLFKQPLLSQSNVNRFINRTEQVTMNLIDYIKLKRNLNNEMDDFQEDLYKWGLESIFLLMLDTRLGCLNFDITHDSEAANLIKSAHDTIDAIMRTETGSDSWVKKETNDYKKLVNAQDIMAKIVDKYFSKKVESLDDDKDSMISQFFQHPQANYKDIFAMIIDLILAGIDTTSFTGGFALYYLAKNPDLQRLLRQEINNVVSGKEDALSHDKLAKMPYLKACVKETMRLQPVSIGVGRVSTQNMVIKDYEIPIDTMIITHNQIASRQEKHFPQADSFCPERWLANQRPTPFVSLPFGYGPRMCIGRRISEMELYVLLVKLIKNFSIEYHHEDIGIKTRLINIPNRPMRFRLIDL